MGTIVCRCEDISLEEIESAIERGYKDIESLKRHLRISMGHCQGRGCLPLVMSILEKKTGIKQKYILPPTVRQPIVPVLFSTFCGEECSGNHEK